MIFCLRGKPDYGDESLSKIDKAKFPEDITQNILIAETLPDKPTCIVDAMSIIRKWEGSDKTLRDVAKAALKTFLRHGGEYNNDRAGT